MRTDGGARNVRDGDAGSDEWEIERLDLPAYLDRIGHTGVLEPTGQTLTALHRAHIGSIPFENLDLVLGRSIGVDLDSVQAKLVTRRRGGYCYEHGVLFAAVLEALGYRVERLLARIGYDTQRPRARTHLTLRVDGSDGSWLADVGFGAGPLEPIAWPPAWTGEPVHQGGWTYRIVTETGGMSQLQEQRNTDGGQWDSLYSLSHERQHASDIAVANHYTSTHSGSPFVGRQVAVRRDPHVLRRLRGRELDLTHSDGSAEHHVLADAEAVEVLGADFGIELDANESAELLAALPSDPTA